MGVSESFDSLDAERPSPVRSAELEACRGLLDALPEPAWVFDLLSRRVLLVNAPALALLGVQPSALLDFAEDTEGTYLARELVDGSDLAQLTATLRARGEALPFELAAFVACEVARALQPGFEIERADQRLQHVAKHVDAIARAIVARLLAEHHMRL